MISGRISSAALPLSIESGIPGRAEDSDDDPLNPARQILDDRHGCGQQDRGQEGGDGDSTYDDQRHRVIVGAPESRALDDDRNEAENRGQGGHQDRPQALPATPQHGCRAGAALSLVTVDVLDEDDAVVDVPNAVSGIDYNSPQDLIGKLIENFSQHRASLQEAVDRGTGISLNQVRLRSPLPKPPNIICMAVNYMEDGTRDEPAPCLLYTSPSPRD